MNHHSLDNRIWFTIIFLPLKNSLTVFQIWILFIKPSPISVSIGVMEVIEDRVTKIREHQQKPFFTLSGFWSLREWGWGGGWGLLTVWLLQVTGEPRNLGKSCDTTIVSLRFFPLHLCSINL